MCCSSIGVGNIAIVRSNSTLHWVCRRSSTGDGCVVHSVHAEKRRVKNIWSNITGHYWAHWNRLLLYTLYPTPVSQEHQDLSVTRGVARIWRLRKHGIISARSKRAVRTFELMNY